MVKSRLYQLLLWLVCVVTLAGCQTTKVADPASARAVYYWRTEYRLSAAERTFLSDHRVSHLYMHLFDVIRRGGGYYALAANPASGAVPAFAYDFESSEFRLTASRGDALNAYGWLRQHRDNSHPVYKSCDWLGLYVTERK